MDYDHKLKEAIQAGHLNKFGMEQYEKCGSSTFEIKTFGESAIFSMEPMNRQALATKPEDWEREDRRGGKPFFGIGILNQNGSAWRRTRDMVNPLFKRAELDELENFGKFVNRMIALIPRDGSTVDLQPLLRKLVSATPTYRLEDDSSFPKDYPSFWTAQPSLSLESLSILCVTAQRSRTSSSPHSTERRPGQESVYVRLDS